MFKYIYNYLSNLSWWHISNLSNMNRYHICSSQFWTDAINLMFKSANMHKCHIPTSKFWTDAIFLLLKSEHMQYIYINVNGYVNGCHVSICQIWTDAIYLLLKSEQMPYVHLQKFSCVYTVKHKSSIQYFRSPAAK